MLSCVLEAVCHCELLELMPPAIWYYQNVLLSMLQSIANQNPYPHICLVVMHAEGVVHHHFHITG